jgi:four helix bundle protein
VRLEAVFSQIISIIHFSILNGNGLFYEKMRNYKNYLVWNESHELVLFIYKQIVPLLPRDERYELTSQMKRAAYSIPINIAEGCGRNSDKDFNHYLDVSLGSANELQYCILLIRDLAYLDNERYEVLCRKVNTIRAMLIKLIKSIREPKSLKREAIISLKHKA